MHIVKSTSVMMAIETSRMSVCVSILQAHEKSFCFFFQNTWMSQTSSAALHILRARCVITMACVRHVSSDVSSRAKLILLFLVVIFSINHLILTRHLFTPFTFHLYKLNRFKETQILINQTFHANMHKITIPTNYDINNIIFQAPVCEEKKLADGKPLVYWRVPIKTKLSNGTEGDLLILFDESPCFGISNQYGYSMGISMLIVMVQQLTKRQPLTCSMILLRRRRTSYLRTRVF